MILRWAHRSANSLEFKQLFTPVIGLEVHVQLATKTKLFSPAPVQDDAPPNSVVHAFDMATPGTMPRLNRQCVMLALRMAHALRCEIPPWSRFDRKHYFYADMPAGYQITQADHPIATNGRLDVPIERLQLEQDSGKTMHQDGSSLVDLNRAGVPLVEVVTAPVFRSALEATCFVRQLRLILMHYQVSRGQLHKGHLRVDANVSLGKDGENGVRTEIKNLNSVRLLHTAINYEIDRQYGILSTGGRVVNETRGTDAQGRTVAMRDKEEETDYRMMVEPNLPDLRIHDRWLADTRHSVDALGLAPHQKRIADFGIDPPEDEQLSHFFDACAGNLNKSAEQSVDKVSIKLFLNYLQDVKNICQREELPYPPRSTAFPGQFCSTLLLLEHDRITRLVALATLRAALRGEIDDVEKHITDEKLWRISELGEIQTIFDDILVVDGALLAKARGGNAKAFTRLRNAIIDRSRRCVTVDDAESFLRRVLNEQESSA
ncbi:unnamed protein product, partial [Mesorhabditis spiculigera]